MLLDEDLVSEEESDTYNGQDEVYPCAKDTRLFENFLIGCDCLVLSTKLAKRRRRKSSVILYLVAYSCPEFCSLPSRRLNFRLTGLLSSLFLLFL